MQEAAARAIMQRTNLSVATGTEVRSAIRDKTFRNPDRGDRIPTRVVNERRISDPNEKCESASSKTPGLYATRCRPSLRQSGPLPSNRVTMSSR